MFTDATRAMAVGSGEKDNKKALAQRKRQVVLFGCLFVILFVCSFVCLFGSERKSRLFRLVTIID